MTQVDWFQPRAPGYSTVLADPPWPESGGGKVKRGADRHYPLMRIDDIAKLPVRDIARPDAHLYLWATNNHLPGALEVMRAWGFRYVTNVCWGKVSATGVVQQGLGQYFRGAHELLLFGVRGKVPYRTLPDGKRAQHPTLVLAPRGEHSRKPDVFHEVIEKVSPGPYVELFARRARPGWAVWGNQAPNPVVLEPPPT